MDSVLLKMLFWRLPAKDLALKLLAPQSGALRISAYRDFQSRPTYSFRAFKPFYGDLKQPKQTKADQCRPRQTKADQGRPRQTTADQGRPWQTKADYGRRRQTMKDQGRPSHCDIHGATSISDAFDFHADCLLTRISLN